MVQKSWRGCRARSGWWSESDPPRKPLDDSPAELPAEDRDRAGRLSETAVLRDEDAVADWLLSLSPTTDTRGHRPPPEGRLAAPAP